MRYLLLFLLPSICFAGNPFKLIDLYVEIETPFGQTRTLQPYEYAPYNEVKHGELNLGMLSEAKFKYFKVYSEIEVTSVYTSSQFREVALETELGFTKDYVDLYVRHYSGHALDMRFNDYYPQDNAVGIRIHFNN